MNKIAKLLTALFICTITILSLNISVKADGDWFYSCPSFPAWLNAIDNHDFTYNINWFTKSGTTYAQAEITGGGRTGTVKEIYWYAMTNTYREGYVGDYYVCRYFTTDRNVRHYYLLMKGSSQSGYSAYLVCKEDWDTDILQIDGNHYDMTTSKVPAHSHVWDEGTITVEPTYESDGQKECHCTICGQSGTVTIPKLEDFLEPTPTPTPEPTDILEPTPEPTPEPSPEPTPVPEPDPVIIYDGMETISGNSIKFYEDTGQRLFNIEQAALNNSVSLNEIKEKLNLYDSKFSNIESYTRSISENTLELVNQNRNDINNSDMLDQLSGNIEDLNKKLTELSTYLGYFFAFMIFIMIAFIFRMTWKLIDKYLLNTTLR